MNRIRDAVAFRCPHESRTGDHPQKPEFGLEVDAHILIAMIMADLQTRRDRHSEGPELLADALQSAVIDGHEDSHGAVHQRDGAGGIGAPHLMRLVSEDRAVVGVRSQNPSGSARGQVVGLPHQAENPALGGANPPDTEARPDFAVPFAHKR